MDLAAEADPVEQNARPPFQLRGGAYTMIVLRLTEPKHPAFYQMLMEKVAQAPGFFTDAPVVLDLQDLADAPPFNMAELRRRLRQHRLMAFGVQNATEEQNQIAINAGMVVLPPGRQAPIRSAPRPAPAADADAAQTAQAASAETTASAATTTQPAGEAANETAPASAEAASLDEEPAAEATVSKVVIQPVRSGRQIYAQGGDLIVLASISPGAELIADGHIHVYGTLRGRALAGIAGNTDARIFCRSLEAELVSIGGYWRVRDDIPEELIGKPVQIHLDGEHVVIESLA